MSESYLGATESILRWILYEQKKDLSCEVVLRISGGSRHQRLLKHRNGADQVLGLTANPLLSQDLGYHSEEWRRYGPRCNNRNPVVEKTRGGHSGKRACFSGGG
jgi:hypothetical protein